MTVPKKSAISYSRVSSSQELSAVEKMHTEMLTMFAKHYSQTLSENVKRGLRAKKERELAQKKLSTMQTSQVNQSKV